MDKRILAICFGFSKGSAGYRLIKAHRLGLMNTKNENKFIFSLCFKSLEFEEERSFENNLKLGVSELLDYFTWASKIIILFPQNIINGSDYILEFIMKMNKEVKHIGEFINNGRLTKKELELIFLYNGKVGILTKIEEIITSWKLKNMIKPVFSIKNIKIRNIRINVYKTEGNNLEKFFRIGFDS